MTGSLHKFLAGAVLAATAVPLLAGGLYITLGNPQASPAATSAGAVLTLKLAGCHEPEKAQVNAIAIGRIHGREEKIALKLISLPEPGMYALTRQWPAEGNWVLRFIGKDGDRVTSTLVAAGPGGIDRNGAKMAMRLPDEKEIAALLDNAPKADVARR